MSKRFEIVRWSDDAIGQGFQIFAHGEFLGTSDSIHLLRKLARGFWSGIKNAPTSAAAVAAIGGTWHTAQGGAFYCALPDGSFWVASHDGWLEVDQDEWEDAQ